MRAGSESARTWALHAPVWTNSGANNLGLSWEGLEGSAHGASCWRSIRGSAQPEVRTEGRSGHRSGMPRPGLWLGELLVPPAALFLRKPMLRFPRRSGGPNSAPHHRPPRNKRRWRLHNSPKHERARREFPNDPRSGLRSGPPQVDLARAPEPFPTSWRARRCNGSRVVLAQARVATSRFGLLSESRACCASSKTSRLVRADLTV